MKEIILIIFTISIILYYIFDTNVVWEYLNKISKVLKGQWWRMFFHGVLLIGPAEGQKSYIAYINEKYNNNFFVKLICCPICLGTWMSIASILIAQLSIMYFGAIIWCALSLYYVIKILTKQSSKL